VKFLVDICTGRRLAIWLREQGHDVCEVNERSAKMEDNEILQWANTEKRIVITVDKDFGTLAVALGQPHHGIIRLPDVPALNRQILMEEVLRRHSKDLENRAIITVSEKRIRIRQG
jgi:predicted nuclease of predicted toxin-antitoxin system